MITVTIPTHSYLKKFVLHRFQSTTGRIDVTTRRSYGIDLLKIFQKRTPFNPRKRSINYNDDITVNVSDYYASASGLFISNENIDLFNNKIKFDFEESLYDHLLILMTTREDVKIEEEILRYLRFYSISEDELMLKSVVKDFYRWRKNRKFLLVK
jgi:hypothetical protein